MGNSSGGIRAVRTADTLHDRWWVTIVGPYLLMGVGYVAVIVPPATSYPSRLAYVLVARSIAVLFVFSLLLAIVGLYFDRLYVAEVSGWTPSTWYVLMFFVPYAGIFVAFHYLYQRRRHAGVP